MLLLASTLIFVTVLIFFYLVLLSIFEKERYIDRIENASEEVVTEDKRISTRSKGTIFSGIAKKLPKFNSAGRSKMELTLLRANLKMSVEELLIYRLLYCSALTFIVFVLKNDYFLAGVTLIAVWKLPLMWINSRVKKRVNDFNEQLNGGLNLISNSLKAGHSFMQALSISARETQGAFSEEMKILLKEMNFGIPMDVALKNLLDRVDSKDMRLVVNAILIQKDIGGNLSEILENISETIRERQKIKTEMRTLTAQGKMSGMIVMLMPVFLGGIFYLINREYIMLLFTTDIGLIMLAASVVNEIIGAAIIKKIITIEM